MKSKPIKIAFSGKQRSGKDTAADYLISKLPEGSGHIRLSFALEVKAARSSLQSRLGFPIARDRELEQFIGEWARSKNENIWVDRVEISIRSFPELNTFVTDCRYPNELAMLERHGFTIIRIEAELQHSLNAGATSLLHPSETALDGHNFEHVIHNDFTENFFRKLDDIYIQILLGEK